MTLLAQTNHSLALADGAEHGGEVNGAAHVLYII